MAVPTSSTLAHDVLGPGFIHPKEFADAFEMSYSPEQLAELERTLPDRSVTHWMADNGFMLIPGPPAKMTLIEVVRLRPNFFFSRGGGWMAESKKSCVVSEDVGCQWLMLCQDVVPESASKSTWLEQFQLVSRRKEDFHGKEDDPHHLLLKLSKKLLVPTAVKTTFGVVVFKTVRGVNLLGEIYARTQSVDARGLHATVGGTDSGIGVDMYGGGGRGGFPVGVAAEIVDDHRAS